jgi:hypothetical protein
VCGDVAAQFSFLLLGRSPACFGQTDWLSSGIEILRCFKLELSRMVTTVVFTFTKMVKIGLWFKYIWNIIKIKIRIMQN